MSEYPREDQNREYLITSAQHRLHTDEFQTTGSPETHQVSQSTFTAMDAQEVYRPQRLTPKPIVQGPQTAIVVGEAGEEISTDQYGRVKVQFHWDHYGKMDENSCCFLRVSNSWAGKNWGAIHIPCIGQEVIVSFLEGDPDQPLVTGRVYNGEQMPPWELPANMTQSGILSRSTKGGSAANANAIRMEDKKGSEQLWIHAEKNQDIEVENDETHWVGHDRTKTIDHDEMVHVKHDRTERVDNDESISIGRDRFLTVERDKFEKVQRKKAIQVASSHSESIGSSMTISVGSTLTE